MPRKAPLWAVVVGAMFGALTLLFFMGLILLAIFGHEIPCESRFLVATVVAFGAALSVAFLGGAIAAKGVIPLPFATEHPVSFSATGGAAILVLLLILGNSLYSETCGDEPTLACADGYQSHYVSQLRFGFCYPRRAWELDSGPIDARAADIYLRYSNDRDIGVHYHLSLIPIAFVGKEQDYFDNIVKTWSQLDPNIQAGKVYVGGREAYQFSLLVGDSKQRQKPTTVTHIYLSSEKLLEIISTRFDYTSAEATEQMQTIVSSSVVYK